MIYYLASYPRSGNFWVQSLIANQFGRLVTGIHGLKGKRRKIREHKGYVITPIPDDELFFVYTNPYEPGREYRGLMHGFGEHWTEALRQELASQDKHYFVKTHFHPYNTYFPGEYIIRITRNPGAALWSYYHFIRDIQQRDDMTLTDFIEGRAGFGCWAKYQQVWFNAMPRLQDRCTHVYYEDLFNNELSFCERLAPFLGLPILSTDIKPFEYYHAIRPDLHREGKAHGWEVHYTKAQLIQLWDTHGAMMVAHGYPEPDYTMGLADDEPAPKASQVRHLWRRLVGWGHRLLASVINHK